MGGDAVNPTAKLIEEATRRGITLKPTADGLYLRAEVEPRPEFIEHLKTNRDRLRDELTRICRNGGEDKEIGAPWCRTCWRYKVAPCVATGRKITGGDPRAWIVEGDATVTK
jgi:predicted ThiF/HesA family dinucleotide-utilizing enzyme